MKRAGVIMMLLSLFIILFLPVATKIKFFLGGFGIVGGLVLIGIAGYTYMD